MLKKMRSARTNKASVTFVLSPRLQPYHLHVVGEFNDWRADTPMKRHKDGSWRASIELEAGREYQFRYLADGNWLNDEAADAYVPNPYGEDNSVVRTPAVNAARSMAREG